MCVQSGLQGAYRSKNNRKTFTFPTINWTHDWIVSHLIRLCLPLGTLVVSCCVIIQGRVWDLPLPSSENWQCCIGYVLRVKLPSLWYGKSIGLEFITKITRFQIQVCRQYYIYPIKHRKYLWRIGSNRDTELNILVFGKLMIGCKPIPGLPKQK